MEPPGSSPQSRSEAHRTKQGPRSRGRANHNKGDGLVTQTAAPPAASFKPLNKDFGVEPVSFQGFKVERDSSNDPLDRGLDPFASAKTGTQPDGVRIKDVDEHEQMLQSCYFHITNPNSLIRCRCCGVPGHDADDCPKATCIHCGAMDHHYASACPAFRRCRRCHQRGHESMTCENAMRRRSPDDPCDICGHSGHLEEECSSLARTFDPDTMATVRIPALQMRVACFNCGANKHWGNDCPELLPSERYNLTNADPNSVWSAKHANKFIEPDFEHARQAPEDGGNGTRHYQLAMLDELM